MGESGGPVALVTGGSRGIGLGITRALLAEGYRVAILATRQPPEELLAELGAQGEVVYLQGNVADVEGHAEIVDQILQRWGRIDALVNNAGVAPTVRNDILVASPEEFDRVLSINLRGPYFLTQRVAAAMIGGRGRCDSSPTSPIGTIVNVSSISAEAVSTDRGEYCISKAGVSMATALWAARLASEGILVYEVRPGVIATEMTAAAKQKYEAQFAAGLAPIARWGQPADVAGVVVQLLAGRMPYSTGDIIHVDGGMHIPRL